MTIAEFVKKSRRMHKISQPELAIRAKVGLRFIRDLEQGKKTLRMDKVNAVLYYFVYQQGVVEVDLTISN
ncbi:MAG: hypothetical protein RL348_162 [Bacteroidota bacterium]